MSGLAGYSQCGFGPKVCVCGFVYPWTPQANWTDSEAKSVAAHQQAHSQSPQTVAQDQQK